MCVDLFDVELFNYEDIVEAVVLNAGLLTNAPYPTPVEKLDVRTPTLGETERAHDRIAEH
jgi:hypothetical protein